MVKVEFGMTSDFDKFTDEMEFPPGTTMEEIEAELVQWVLQYVDHWVIIKEGEVKQREAMGDHGSKDSELE